jgi:hypothetical protein
VTGSGGPRMLHPAVRDLFRAMAARKMSCGKMAKATGLHHRTFEEWRIGRRPTVEALSRALAVVGMHLEVMPDAIWPKSD